MRLWVSVPVGLGIRVGGRVGGGKRHGPSAWWLVPFFAVTIVIYEAFQHWWVAAILGAAVALTVWLLFRAAVPKGQRILFLRAIPRRIVDSARLPPR